MSFQNTVLPPSTITELYRNLLVFPTDESKKVPPKKIDEPPVKFLGNNAKNIAIIVNHVTEVFLPEKHLDLISKMLTACKLNLGDVAIINQGTGFTDIEKIKTHLRPRQIILFGVEPVEIKLPLTFPHFKIQPYANTDYLSVPSLDVLNSEGEEGKLLKTKLWVCLKSMFEVNNSRLTS